MRWHVTMQPGRALGKVTSMFVTDEVDGAALWMRSSGRTSGYAPAERHGISRTVINGDVSA